MIVIYVLADVGSIAGGWLSSWLIDAGLDGQRRPQDGALDLCPVRGARRVLPPWCRTCGGQSR